MPESPILAEACHRRYVVAYVAYTRKVTFLRLTRGKKVRFVHQNNAASYVLPKNGFWGHIAPSSRLQVIHLQRLSSVEDPTIPLGTRYRTDAKRRPS